MDKHAGLVSKISLFTSTTLVGTHFFSNKHLSPLAETVFYFVLKVMIFVFLIFSFFKDRFIAYKHNLKIIPANEPASHH